MTPPECPNPRCFGYPGIWQRTDFDGGRITEVYVCARCKREYEQVATTLVMLPDTEGILGAGGDTERITPLKDEVTNG